MDEEGRVGRVDSKGGRIVAITVVIKRLHRGGGCHQLRSWQKCLGGDVRSGTRSVAIAFVGIYRCSVGGS